MSLHNADHGGAFYMTSRDIPAPTAELARHPAAAGLTLNPIDEPFSELEAHAPGVFAFHDFERLATAIAAKGGDVKAVWPAGNSSAAHAARHHGTFSLVCAVPVWDDPRLRDEGPSPFTMADEIGLLQRWNTEAAAAMARHDLRGLAALAGSSDAGELLAALDEAASAIQWQNAELGELASSPRMATRLRVCEHALSDRTGGAARGGHARGGAGPDAGRAAGEGHPRDGQSALRMSAASAAHRSTRASAGP